MATKDAPKSGASTSAPAASDDGVVVCVPEVPWYKQLLAIKDTIIIVLTPLIFLPIFAFSTSPVSQFFFSIFYVYI
jgi:hypothetical protein